MKRWAGQPRPEPREDPDVFVVSDWYVYDSYESTMRVTYSVMIISVHIKILNVLSFYPSVAFLVKIMEKLVEVLRTFIAFFFFLICMYSFAYLALDLIFNNGDIADPRGDYIGLGDIYGATIMYSIRMAVGDFDISTYKNLPTPQKVIAFVLFISSIVLLVLIYVNINVQVIEGVLGEVNERRLEEAYQKKCNVLCELRGVFGSIARRKQQNVLVTRCWLSDFDVSNDMNH